MSDFDDTCRRAGLTWVYRDGAGRMQEAPEDSRRAVLAALTALPDDLRQATSLAIAAGQAKDWGPGPWVLTTEAGGDIRGEGPLPPLPVGYHRIRHNGWLVHLLAAPPRLPAPPRRCARPTPSRSTTSPRAPYQRRRRSPPRPPPRPNPERPAD